jgi:hypothetical protein
MLSSAQFYRAASRLAHLQQHRREPSPKCSLSPTEASDTGMHGSAHARSGPRWFRDGFRAVRNPSALVTPPSITDCFGLYLVKDQQANISFRYRAMNSPADGRDGERSSFRNGVGSGQNSRLYGSAVVRVVGRTLSILTAKT